MAKSARDVNRIPTVIAVSSVDGTTPTLLEVDPTTGELLVKTNFVAPSYDYIALTYTGSNLTQVVYKTGGASGTVVATLTLVYTGSQLDSITKT